MSLLDPEEIAGQSYPNSEAVSTPIADRKRATLQAMELPEDAELKIAAAAVAGAVAPPLGVAVAAGAALRSPRVRQALRKGAVRALSTAMEAGDELTRRAAPSAADEESSASAVKP